MPKTNRRATFHPNACFGGLEQVFEDKSRSSSIPLKGIKINTVTFTTPCPKPPAQPSKYNQKRAFKAAVENYFPPILNILVPQTGHDPVIAGLPFFILTSLASFICLFCLHFMQYPSINSLSLIRRILIKNPIVDLQVLWQGLNGRGLAHSWSFRTELWSAVC